jgi:NTE family protein
MRRALVLAGGGARGAYQVGMLHELVINKGLDFQIIRGVSVGALNAAFLAQASTQRDSLSNLKKKVELLYRLWRYEITGNHSVYAERGGFAGIVAGADSLYSLEPLRTLINKHVNIKHLKSSKRDFKVGTVSLVTAQYNEWGTDDRDFIDKLIASASIPVVFPYVDLKSAKDILIDGGVRNISPLSSAFDANPDEIYILLTSRLIKNGTRFPDSGVQEHNYKRWDDNWLGTKVSGLDVLKRTIEILTDEIYLDDLRGALEWNEIIKNIEAVKQTSKSQVLPANLTNAITALVDKVKKRYVPLYVLAPQDWYGEENSSTEFSPGLIEQAINHGIEIASEPNKWLYP